MPNHFPLVDGSQILSRRRARLKAGEPVVAERRAFLVDRDGTVRGAWRYETAEVPDFDELLSAARAL